MTQTARRQIILNFHGIGTPHTDVPADEAPYWLPDDRFAEIIGRIALHRASGRDIHITFDDGNRSDLEIGAPLLAEKGMQGTFFLLTGRLGQTNYLSADDVRTLIGMGMEIGLHGRDHVDWRRLDGPGLERETIQARADLAKIAERPIREVGIPFGAYNRRIIGHLKAQEFSVIYTSDGGSTRPGARIRPRTSLRADMKDTTLEEILAGRQTSYARLRRAVSGFLRQRLV